MPWKQNSMLESHLIRMGPCERGETIPLNATPKTGLGGYLDLRIELMWSNGMGEFVKRVIRKLPLLLDLLMGTS